MQGLEGPQGLEGLQGLQRLEGPLEELAAVSAQVTDPVTDPVDRYPGHRFSNRR